jgi:signal transduction histidine kinase
LNYVGKVYFRDESEPYVSISVARDSTSSVLAVEVNLTHIWDVIAQAQLNPDVVAFVVDSQGQLVSHPDLGLVLAKTDLSALPHVRSALEHPAQGAALISEARDMAGQRVVSTSVSIPNLGWTVFAEEPVEQALRPVYDSITRSAALIALGVVAAIATSVLLARRMVRPIHEIESRARLLGEGDFSQRIELSTGDELEAMATRFNRMAARLQDLHDKQELRIAERTHELAIANEGKSRFLAAASHDLRQPLHALALFTGELRSIHLPSRDCDRIRGVLQEEPVRSDSDCEPLARYWFAMRRSSANPRTRDRALAGVRSSRPESRRAGSASHLAIRRLTLARLAQLSRNRRPVPEYRAENEDGGRTS